MKKIIYKPSPKMKRVWREAASAKFRWLVGAVRSGKTFLANDLSLYEIQKMPGCDILISGYSITSIARNVISEWRKLIDPQDTGVFRQIREGKDDYLHIDWRGLRNKKIYLRGAGKENDYKAIQGGTFGYWYSDEVVRHHESFTNMAMTRLSLPYSKALGTTNPDTPFHPFKKHILDNKALFTENNNGYALHKEWLFRINDNPSLTKEYIDSLKRMFTGVFYERFILSRWVMAEGIIYDFFNVNDFTYTGNIPTRYHAVAIDYGTSAPTCFILFGIDFNPLAKRKAWAIREYFYDPNSKGRQKTDREYSEDLKNFLGGIIPYKIIVDPSAASFKTQLRKDGFPAPIDANNDIVNGIRTHMKMLKSGEYIINRDKCPRTIQDYGGYGWDEKAQLKGIDTPAPGSAEHTKDTERYLLHTLFGNYVCNLERLTKW